MDEKKSRSQFDQTEKSVFWSIVKTQQDGKLWKTITESKNNTARRDAWRAVAQAFANHIGKDFSAVQAKELFKRMKMAKKKTTTRELLTEILKRPVLELVEVLAQILPSLRMEMIWRIIMTWMTLSQLKQISMCWFRQVTGSFSNLGLPPPLLELVRELNLIERFWEN